MTTIYPIRYRSVCDREHSDRLAVSTFLSQIEDEQPSIPGQSNKHDADILFAQANMVSGTHNNRLVSLITYELHDRAGPDATQSAAIRTIAIAKKYRTTHIFYTGLKQVAADCAAIGVRQVELWVPEQSRWLNKCCTALATPIGTQLDQDEQCCIVYQTDVERIQAVLKQHNIQSVAYLPGYDSMMVAMVQAM